MSLAALFVLAALGAIAGPARAQPGPPTVTLSPAPSGGEVAAATIAFTVDWAAGWDGSALSADMSDTSGHLHFMVDGNPPAMHFAAPGATSTERSFSFDRGPHSVMVELVNPNHMPYNPPALAQVQFEVTLTEEGIAILGEIGSVQGDVDTLQGDVDGLQGDVGTLQGDVGGLRTALGTLTGLLYAVIVLAIISILIGIGAIAQGRKRRTP